MTPSPSLVRLPALDERVGQIFYVHSAHCRALSGSSRHPSRVLPGAGPQTASLRPALKFTHRDVRPAAVLLVASHSELRELQLAGDLKRTGPAGLGATSSEPAMVPNDSGAARLSRARRYLARTRRSLGAVCRPSAPRLAMSVPRSRRWSASRQPSQFPVAHGQSVAH